MRTVNIYASAENYDSIKRTGRKSNFSERNIRYLVSKVRSYPSLTSTDLSKELSGTTNSYVAASSIRRILSKRGLKSYSARKKPFITKYMAKRRLAWCLEYKDKTPEFWSNVLFSDETAVELNLISPINRVRRFKFENPNKLQFISPKVKFPLKVMFWGGVSAHHKTNLVECIGSMNSQSYIENVLCKEVLPFNE